MDHPSLHDPHYYEPYDYEDRHEAHQEAVDVEASFWEHVRHDYVQVYLSNGGACLYNPDDNKQIYVMRLNEDNQVLLERYSTDGAFLSLVGVFSSLDEVFEDFPEFGAQVVYPGIRPY